MTRTLTACLLVLALTAPTFAQDTTKRKHLKAGLIGLDTSHVIAFTKVINAAKDPKKDGDLAYLTVVAGYPGGSPDVPASANRVEKFTEQLRGMGIEIVDSIPALLEKVDVVLLESVDGRPHLKQAIPVIKAGKPLFIDKPAAGSLADLIAIDQLATKHGVPWFTSSSLRFSPGIISFRGEHEKVGKVMGCNAWGPASLEPHHPDLFWYGIHGCEVLFTVMGTGCRTVTRVQTDHTEYVTGTWADGRVGTFRGLRSPNKNGYGAFVFGTKGMSQTGSYSGYGPLVAEIATFFQTHKPPVSNDESIELYAFMEAADVSKKAGGKPVHILDVIGAATRAAARAGVE